MKILVSIFLVLIGAFSLGFYLAGSHAHFRFRLNMPEDWIFSIIIITSFMLPIYFLISWLINKLKV